MSGMARMLGSAAGPTPSLCRVEMQGFQLGLGLAGRDSRSLWHCGRVSVSQPASLGLQEVRAALISFDMQCVCVAHASFVALPCAGSQTG